MASISRTIWPLATPPIAGLQLICAIVPMFMVINSTEEPRLAAAAAASQPAWPAPTTITLYFSNILPPCSTWNIQFFLIYLKLQLQCSTWNIQNYTHFSDVPRGTLNNDTNATKAQMP